MRYLEMYETRNVRCTLLIMGMEHICIDYRRLRWEEGEKVRQVRSEVQW